MVPLDQEPRSIFQPCACRFLEFPLSAYDHQPHPPVEPTQGSQYVSSQNCAVWQWPCNQPSSRFCNQPYTVATASVITRISKVRSYRVFHHVGSLRTTFYEKPIVGQGINNELIVPLHWLTHKQQPITCIPANATSYLHSDLPFPGLAKPRIDAFFLPKNCVSTTSSLQKPCIDYFIAPKTVYQRLHRSQNHVSTIGLGVFFLLLSPHFAFF